MASHKNTFDERQDRDAPVQSGFSGARDYFTKNVLPEDIRTHLHRFKAPTPYANNREQVFMLVRSGTGKLVVNGVSYPLKPDTLINLGPFHRFRFLPDPGKTLEVVDARMNSGTYVYMIANPYLKMNQFYVTSEPPVAQLSGLYAQIANDSMAGLLREMKDQDPDKNSLCFCYMMDLLGILTDMMPRAYFTKPDKASQEEES